MNRLLITGCTDSMRWYSGMVGEYVPYLGKVKDPDEYRSRDNGGYNNFVQIEDARIIWDADYDITE